MKFSLLSLIRSGLFKEKALLTPERRAVASLDPNNTKYLSCHQCGHKTVLKAKINTNDLECEQCYNTHDLQLISYRWIKSLV